MNEQVETTDCSWLERHFDALYEHDARGRATRRREPGAVPVPRFHLGRTRHGNLWRIRHDVSPALASRLSRLAAREALLPGGDPPWPAALRLADLRSALEEAGPVEAEWGGVAFRFPEALLGASRSSGPGLAWIDPADPRATVALEDAFPGLAAVIADRLPCVVAHDEGRIVSACYSAAGDGAGPAEAGVDTLEGFRGRGHASRCVTAWAQRVAELGGQPLYSTDWLNAPSLALARRLGLITYADSVYWV